jgi:hypothetical protein
MTAPQTAALADLIPGPEAGFPAGQCWEIRWPGVGAAAAGAAALAAARPDLVVFRLDDHAWIEGPRPFAGWGDVAACTLEPWADGLRQVGEIADAIGAAALPPPVTRRRRTVWDEEQGNSIDLDRYRAAAPFWRDSRRERVSGPQMVSLLVDTCGNSHRSGRDLFFRGGLCVALARILEDAGYAVEVAAFNASAGAYADGAHVLQRFEVKAAGDQIDAGAVAVACSGWFFRTVGFGGFLAPLRPMNPWLGSHREPTPAMVARLAVGAEPWLVAGVYDLESAVALARTLLARLAAE